MTSMCNINIRMSREEKLRIEQKAKQFGSTVSDYARTVLQEPCAEIGGSLAQVLAVALCEHAELVKQLSSQSLRADFAKWEEKIWRAIP